jgi:hypothetical protein
MVVELAAPAEYVDAHHLFVGTRNRAPDYKRGISIDHKIHTLTRAHSATLRKSERVTTPRCVHVASRSLELEREERKLSVSVSLFHGKN